MADDITFQNIDRPYDNFLDRVDLTQADDSSLNNTVDSTATTSTSTTPSSTTAAGNVETMPVKSDGSMDDIWINNFIRSVNWQPKSVGFYIDGQSGKAEFTDVYISGEIDALSGQIGGFSIGSTDLVTTINGYTTTISSEGIAFSAGPTGAPTVTITQAGVLNATGANISGTLTATLGFIGGWTITANSIHDTSGTTGMSSAITGGDDIRFWAGNVVPVSAPFKVTEAGVITASSGTIGGCVLATTSIGSTLFVSGPLGSGWNISNTGTAEFQNVTIRGTIRTSVFEKDTISAVNGIVLVSSADILANDMTTLDASVVVISGQTTFSTNEVVRIKDGTDDEWMLVTNASSAPAYIVTRDLGGSYTTNNKPAWKKGTTIVSMGVGTGNKTGFVLLDSSSTYSPYIDVYGRNSNTYTDYSLHGRFGWLKGITDTNVGLATTDVWGLYTDNAFIKGVIVATSGKIGTTTNYWNINAKGITAVSASDDIFINYGKTDFTNTDSGFILGYDNSAAAAKFFIGNSSTYINWDGTGITIRAQHSNLMIYDTVVDAAGFGDYTTLSAATMAGKKNIFVRNGNYTETSEIPIYNSTFIEGESVDGVVMTFSPGESGLFFLSIYNPTIDINNNVSIKNITFTTDPAYSNGGTLCSGRYINFSNCVFYGWTQGALNLFSGTFVIGGITYQQGWHKVENCSFYNNFQTAINISGYNITVQNNRFRNNYTTATTRLNCAVSMYGLYGIIKNNVFDTEVGGAILIGGDYNNISDNIITGCGATINDAAGISTPYGTVGWNAYANIISNNIINQCPVGIWIGNSSGNIAFQNIISNNVIINCRRGGITVSFANFTRVLGNQLNDNTTDANNTYTEILIDNSPYVNVSDNFVLGSASTKPQYGIRLTANSNYCIVLGNHAYNAATTDISDGGTSNDVNHNMG